MFKSIKKRLKDQRGLTLVELLAVVVILGIIAGIAVPNIGGIIEKTKNDAKVAEGVQIIQAAKLYASSQKPNFVSAGVTTPRLEAKISNTELGNYLENLKDTDYQVRIVKNSTTGKYEYYLMNHDASGVTGITTDVLGIKESELLDY